MDPYQLLKNDHRKVSDLLTRAESSHGNAKIQLFKQIKTELDLHSHVEEAFFYPALERAQESRDLTLEAYQEHKIVKELLAELDHAATPSDDWNAKFKVLRENVEHHVEEEEGELFEKAQDVLGDEEANRIGDEMDAEKIRLGGDPAAVTEEKTGGIIAAVKRVLGLSGSKTRRKPAKKRAAKSSKTAKRAAKKATSKRKLTKTRAGQKTVKKSSKKRSRRRTATKKKAAGKRGAKRRTR